MQLRGNVVVLGAGGMLGRQVVAALGRSGTSHRSFARSDLDISDFAALRDALRDARPTTIINCAAFTKVDDCETNVDTAMRINGEAVGVMAEAARIADAVLVHVSTDYVFDGHGTRPYREDDPTGPNAVLSVYGRSKLDGERRIAASGCRHLLVRTSWVFGPGGPNFVDTIRKAAATRPELRVVNDQRGRPTYTVDLCKGIFDAVAAGAEGTLHIANSDECTWFEFAKEIVRVAGVSTPVHPCTTAEFPRPAKRPPYSVLDLSRFTALTGGLRTWREAMAAYLKETSG